MISWLCAFPTCTTSKKPSEQDRTSIMFGSMIKIVDRSKRRQKQPRGVAPSLAATHPELAAQWHPLWNGDKKPEDFPTHSSVVVWWLCPRSHDHVFERAISVRTHSTASHKACPYCSGDLESIIKPLRRPGWKFTSSILDTHLALASQWDFEQNGQWMPEDFTAGSRFVAWWKCPLGHNFQMKISKRTAAKALSMGCAECAQIMRRGRARGKIALSISHPELSEQWDYELNGILSPENVSYGSSRRVHWICPQGPDHKFRSTINARTSSPSETMACPFCAGLKPSVTNSLASCFPELAKEYSAKNKLPADKVVSGSGKRVWWQCSRCAHEWQTAPRYRTDSRQQNGCPKCNLGESLDLSQFPNVFKFFDKELNEGFDPLNLSQTHKYWWRCPRNKDHVFQSSVNRRDVVEKCPYCRNWKASKTNNLQAVNPRVAKELHPTKNGGLRAKDVVAGSGKSLWWRCARNEDHEWKARVHSRAIDGCGCPFCSGLKASKETCLETRYPAIAEELHPTKNGTLTASKLGAISSKKVWWLCKSCSHEWQTWVFARTKNGRGCPLCKQKAGRIKAQPS